MGPSTNVDGERHIREVRWAVAAIADAATRFRCATGAREGMTQLVRALKDHENATATVASRKQAA